jgi:hypothetical protein
MADQQGVLALPASAPQSVINAADRVDFFVADRLLYKWEGETAHEQQPEAQAVFRLPKQNCLGFFV